MSTSNPNPQRAKSEVEPTDFRSSSSALSLLLPVLLVLAVAYGGYYFYSAQESAEPAPVAISPEMLKQKSAEPIQISDISIVEGHVSEVLDELISIVAATKDSESLQAASGAIDDATERWSSLHSTKWPVDAKEKMNEKLTKYIEQLQSALATAYQVPTAQATLQERADNLIDRIKTGMPSP